MTRKKISYACGLIEITDYNPKVTETESKIPSITGLATTALLTAVEN